MSLPKIDNPKPVVTPAVPETTYDAVFIQDIIIQCHPEQPWRCHIAYAPFNYDENKIDETAAKVHKNIADLKVEAATNEKVAVAMGALMAALQDYLT
jgi:hypothetical protein